MQRLTASDVINFKSVFRDRALEELSKIDALEDAHCTGPNFTPAVIVDEDNRPMTSVQAILAIKKAGGVK